MADETKGKTIPEKMATLEAEKVTLLAKVDTVPEPEKPDIQARIATIERQLRWYAARSGKPGRQPKAAAAKKEKAAKKAPTSAPASPATAS